MRLDRSRRAEDDIWLGQKMLFFVIGAVLGVLGMVTDRAWLIYLAITVLAAGLVLRLIGRRSRTATADDEPEPADWSHYQDAPPPDEESAPPPEDDGR